MTTTPHSHLFRAKPDSDVFMRVSAEQAGLERLNMIAMALAAGKKFALTTQNYNYGAVILGGVCQIKTSKGTFEEVGRRSDVFTGMPYAIYLPPNTDFEIEALTDDFQFASCWAVARSERPIKLITPQQTKVQLHAVGRVSNQTNRILDGELLIWEMYVPSTNWAHFPPLAFADAETLLLTKQDRATGFALHRVYDQAHDRALVSEHNDVVVVPRGAYHTMTSSPIGVTYVLGFSASGGGAGTPDKRHAWYSSVYANATIDPRLPVVDIGMEPLDETDA